jgi:hypothetical protein
MVNRGVCSPQIATKNSRIAACQHQESKFESGLPQVDPSAWFSLGLSLLVGCIYKTYTHEAYSHEEYTHEAYTHKTYTHTLYTVTKRILYKTYTHKTYTSVPGFSIFDAVLVKYYFMVKVGAGAAMSRIIPTEPEP